MSSLQRNPIRRRKLADEVLDRLLELIQEGEYRPGDHMPSERELMETFDVGRPAVREALQRLAAMGVVNIQHGERAKVTPLTVSAVINQIDRSARHLLSTTPNGVEYLKDARLFFEVGMVRMAAERATSEDVERLRDAIADMEERMGDRPQFIQADMSFHRYIAEMSGNPIYAAVAQAMLQWLSIFHIDVVSVSGAEDVTVREHKQILERIEAGDSEGAARTMSDHLTRASKLYEVRAGRTSAAEEWPS